ncbi:MAG: DUF3298 and DUF4163 domain-containing protein [Clostridia bacterium]|nr:DUF3298 and DUF4163 domain-containing protein [Clostridia bacterium]
MEIKNKILERNLIYDNTIVLKYHIEYPQIVPDSTVYIRRFNLYNENIALSLQQKAENELFKEAIELYKFNKKNNYPTMVYEVYQNYKITFNSWKIISLFIDEYTFTGGAHGNTIRTSQTWDLSRGRQIELYQFFNNPYFILQILKNIKMQIEENPEIYFDDACCLLIDTFNPQSFYLDQRSIIIYFQQYDIAPYSSGIREFSIFTALLF